MSMTRHAATRVQQRRIPPLVIDVLQSYGKAFRRRGAALYCLDKKGRRLAESYLGPAATHLGRFLNTYVVVSDDGAVITVGYRRQRFRRP